MSYFPFVRLFWSEGDWHNPSTNSFLQSLFPTSTESNVKYMKTDQYLTSNHHRSVALWGSSYAEQNTLLAKRKLVRMLYSQMATNAGCLKSLLGPARQVRKRATTSQENSTSETTRPISVGLPYMSGLSDYLSRVLRAQDICTYHTPYNALRSTLAHPKDRTPTEKKTGVVYDMRRLRRALHWRDCENSWEATGWHQKQTTSAIREHQSQANHEIDWESTFLIKSR